MLQLGHCVITDHIELLSCRQDKPNAMAWLQWGLSGEPFLVIVSPS